MPMGAQAEAVTRVSRGPFRFDQDMAEWITVRAKELRTSEAYIVRQAIRTAMDAEQRDAEVPA